ncbi:uncharacterized protein LOC133750477 [Lepus europaeus]|uniref:uncharacterized protein LOC133750477 n=1 Tax=Lepus europaeus TaxID=9983 RepID=UPI002B4929D8|nr:uncharacterized protein LOC133750477 [Lepus europaeus]
MPGEPGVWPLIAETTNASHTRASPGGPQCSQGPAGGARRPAPGGGAGGRGVALGASGSGAGRSSAAGAVGAAAGSGLLPVSPAPSSQTRRRRLRTLPRARLSSIGSTLTPTVSIPLLYCKDHFPGVFRLHLEVLSPTKIKPERDLDWKNLETKCSSDAPLPEMLQPRRQDGLANLSTGKTRLEFKCCLLSLESVPVWLAAQCTLKAANLRSEE